MYFKINYANFLLQLIENNTRDFITFSQFLQNKLILLKSSKAITTNFYFR